MHIACRVLPPDARHELGALTLGMAVRLANGTIVTTQYKEAGT